MNEELKVAEKQEVSEAECEMPTGVAVCVFIAVVTVFTVFMAIAINLLIYLITSIKEGFIKLFHL